MTTTTYPALSTTIEKAKQLTVPEERKAVLQHLIAYIRQGIAQDEPVLLNFICTHNSRRSQLSQIWAQTAADLHGVEAVCYSGGTEATAFNERAVEAIKRAGFRVSKNGVENPKYYIFHADDANPIVTFSKVYDDAANAQNNFAAVMTCDHADENCPFIPGATRIAVRYEDPKAFDDTPEEPQRYDERSMQIASEMLYVFSQID